MWSPSGYMTLEKMSMLCKFLGFQLLKLNLSASDSNADREGVMSIDRQPAVSDYFKRLNTFMLQSYYCNIK